MQQTVKDDPEAVGRELVAIGTGLVVLDGCHGVGKSTLARSIADLFPCCAIVCGDDCIRIKDIGYMAGMDIGALRERIVWARCQSPIVILDSILARDLLERTGLEAKLFVYVQLNSTLGIPSDLDTLRVGRPVADLFRSEGLHPVKVTITAGTDELVDERGIHHVAKLILISQVQTLLHDGRLQIQKDLADAPVLRAELEDFRATVTDSGRWTFGARSGAHDDLVLALALAVWRANRRQMFVHPDVLRRSAHIRRPQHYLGMMPGRILSQF